MKMQIESDLNNSMVERTEEKLKCQDPDFLIPENYYKDCENLNVTLKVNNSMNDLTFLVFEDNLW